MTVETLVVDANPESLDRTRRALAAAGCSVRAVSSFEDGRRELMQRVPALLVAAVQLGAYNGLHLILRCRQDHPEVATILTHSVVDPVLEREARASGADYAVTPIKPDVIQEIVAKVATALQEQQSDVRRSPRQRPSTGILADLDNQSAALFDFSDGGMRLELPKPPPREVQSPTHVTLPSLGVAVRGERVWQGRADTSGSSGWWCGVRIADADLPRWARVLKAIRKPPPS